MQKVKSYRLKKPIRMLLLVLAFMFVFAAEGSDSLKGIVTFGIASVVCILLTTMEVEVEHEGNKKRV